MAEWFGRILAAVALVAAAPILATCAIAVLVADGPPVVYRAVRTGRGGRSFRVIKLRSMRPTASTTSPAVTTAGDPRVTRIGRVLRRYRLDELPQLWNVVRGDMVLVGPRPEDPRFVDLTDPIHRVVFTATPGITGPTQLAFIDEASMIDRDDPERSYREDILPRKLAIDAAYLRHRSWRLDLWILAHTVAAALGRPPSADAIRARL